MLWILSKVYINNHSTWKIRIPIKACYIRHFNAMNLWRAIPQQVSMWLYISQFYHYLIPPLFKLKKFSGNLFCKSFRLIVLLLSSSNNLGDDSPPKYYGLWCFETNWSLQAWSLHYADSHQSFSPPLIFALSEGESPSFSPTAPLPNILSSFYFPNKFW